MHELGVACAFTDKLRTVAILALNCLHVAEIKKTYILIWKSRFLRVFERVRRLKAFKNSRFDVVVDLAANHDHSDGSTRKNKAVPLFLFFSRCK